MYALFNPLLITLGLTAALALVIVISRSWRRPGPVLAYQNIPEISKLSQSERKISVTYDGRSTDRVTRMRIWFWNAGRKPIDSQDIPAASPFTITLRSPGNITATVFDFRTVKTTGTDVDFHFERTMSPSTLKIDFNRLDHKSGALCELQHDGTTECTPEFQGTIPGSKKNLLVLSVPFDGRKRAAPIPVGGGVKRFFGSSGGLALLLVFSFEMSYLLAAQLYGSVPSRSPALETAVEDLFVDNGIEPGTARRSAHHAVDMAFQQGTGFGLYLLSMSPVFLALSFYTWLRRRNRLPRALRIDTSQSIRSRISRRWKNKAPA